MVYFCALKENTSEEWERKRCIHEEGRDHQKLKAWREDGTEYDSEYEEHETAEGLWFDYNCQEPLCSFSEVQRLARMVWIGVSRRGMVWRGVVVSGRAWQGAAGVARRVLG
jgi:hypothetical protein